MKDLNIFESSTPWYGLSRHPTENKFILGGREFLKSFELNSDNTIKKGSLVSYNNNNSTIELQWCPTNPVKLASATSKMPQILIWDLTNSQTQRKPTVIGKHNQMVGGICWNKINENWLCSCSHDSTWREWTIGKTEYREILCRRNGALIRDWQYHPEEPTLILASSSSGKIYLLDTRWETLKGKYTEFIYNISPSEILTIDWHPTKHDYFCSGGMDNNWCVWDRRVETKPLLVYRTSQGTNNVKWFPGNPQYIWSSYQTYNYEISMWNINMPNIPEYKFIGFMDEIKQFCWDTTMTRWISITKTGKVWCTPIELGIRFFDNISLSLSKFSNDDEWMSFYSEKPPKSKFLDNSPKNTEILNTLSSKNLPKSPVRDLSKFKYWSNSEVHWNKGHLLNYFGFHRDISEETQDISIYNFNMPELKMKNTPSQIDKKQRWNNKTTLTYTVKYQQYYTMDKQQIMEVFKNYVFIIYPGVYRANVNEEINNEQNYIIRLQHAIKANLIQAKKTIENYNHIVIWDNLYQWSKQRSFESINSLLNTNVSTRISTNNENTTAYNELYLDIVKRHVLHILDYLIDIHGDIFLATVISYLFYPIYENDEKVKKRLMHLEIDCWEHLWKCKLFWIANKLKKFGFTEVKKIQEISVVMIWNCNRCANGYDAMNVSKCSNCNRIIICYLCKEQVVGLMWWCSGCGHGGHPEHMREWFKNNSRCPSGCDHCCKADGFNDQDFGRNVDSGMNREERVNKRWFFSKNVLTDYNEN